jgi:hypothetical protein
LLPFSIELSISGSWNRFLDLDKLMAVKRAAGRPKDYELLAELEAIRDERKKLPE